MARPPSGRLELLAGLLAAAAFAVLCRLAVVQVIHPDRYENADGTSYDRKFRLAAQKGSLLDRRQRVLAHCVEVASVAANPQQISDPAAVAAVLQPILGGAETELATKLGRRWRRVLLRREVIPAVEQALAPLVKSGAVTFTNEPGPPSYSLYLFPRQFEAGPADRAALAVVLGLQPADLDRLAASAGEAVRHPGVLDAATAKRVQQLGLPGLLVQANQAPPVRAAWLEPVAAAIEEASADPHHPSLNAVPTVAVKDTVWRDLAPLWAGADRPARELLEARLRAGFVYLAREVPLSVGAAVEQAIQRHRELLRGVSVHREYAREYPQGAVARLLLGRCDVDERGLTNLEAMFNQVLTGEDGYRRVTVSSARQPILQEREELVRPIHGKLVELTIDSVIQAYAEAALRDAVSAADADWGLAVVADPRTGEVLALADAADPNHAARLSIRGLTEAYEPGSILKPLVVGAALEAGVAQATDSYYCAGHQRVGGSILNCIEVHRDETVHDAVCHSCNMVLIQLAQKLGQQRLNGWFEKLGLFHRTGLGLVGQESNGSFFTQEASGAIFTDRGRATWSPEKLATVSYGKGIMCTAVGLVRAYCALLNGGTLPPQLHLVHRLLDRDGTVVVEQPCEPGPRVFSEATARQVRAMMRDVVADRHGTGQIARSQLYDLLAKTGTSIAYGAQGSRVVSFVAGAPAANPRLLVLISVSEPRQGSRMGSTTCGPAARDILEQSLQYLNVPPHRPAASQVAP